MTPPTVTAIVVAAGRGERFGLAAKCMAMLAGRPLLAYSLDAIDAAMTVTDTIVVVGEHTRDAVRQMVDAADWRTPIRIVIGGAERQHSVALGLAATTIDCNVVVIHDAARPLAASAWFDQCVEVASDFGAAVTATPVVDTIKRVHSRKILETVPRDDLWSAQTPQAFDRARLVAALASDTARERSFTDEAGLFEALGWEVHIVTGSAANMKITVAGDLAIAEALLALRQETEASQDGEHGRRSGHMR